MRDIFTINEQLEALMSECVDEETGEFTPTEQLEKLLTEKKEYAEELAKAYINAEAYAKLLDEQKAKYDKRARSAKNKRDWLKRAVYIVLNGEELVTAELAVKYRKSEAVVIDDVSALPDEFLKHTVEPDKTALKSALKLGTQIPGASIETRTNIQIK